MILGFLHTLVMQEEGTISCIAIVQFCFLHRILLVLSFSLSFPGHNPCDARMSKLLVTLSLLDSCAIQLDDFKPIIEVTKEVTVSVH